MQARGETLAAIAELPGVKVSGRAHGVEIRERTTGRAAGCTRSGERRGVCRRRHSGRRWAVNGSAVNSAAPQALCESVDAEGIVPDWLDAQGL